MPAHDRLILDRQLTHGLYMKLARHRNVNISMEKFPSPSRYYHFIPRRYRRLLKRTYLDLISLPAINNALPDFYIIGSMKSGTTGVFRTLQGHPDIVSGKKKEIHFYNTNRDMSTLYYKSFFPRRDMLEARDNAYGRQIIGEATPDYIFHPAAPERCAAVTPDAKFILLMRNPVDRAFSHWKQGKRFAFEPLDFETAISVEAARLDGEAERLTRDRYYYSYNHQQYSYLARGRYVEQIENWLHIFPRERFLFIQSEAIFSDPSRYFSEITNFLGIDNVVVNNFAVRFEGIDGQLDHGIRSRLFNYFSPYNARLYELIGQEFDWS
jgi:hypothetical protein